MYIIYIELSTWSYLQLDGLGQASSRVSLERHSKDWLLLCIYFDPYNVETTKNLVVIVSTKYTMLIVKIFSRTLGLKDNERGLKTKANLYVIHRRLVIQNYELSSLEYAAKWCVLKNLVSYTRDYIISDLIYTVRQLHL